MSSTLLHQIAPELYIRTSKRPYTFLGHVVSDCYTAAVWAGKTYFYHPLHHVLDTFIVAHINSHSSCLTTGLFDLTLDCAYSGLGRIGIRWERLDSGRF